jgi:hypothetical protein
MKIMERFDGLVNAMKLFGNDIINYFYDLDSTERFIVYLIVGILLFYLFYRIFGVLVALAFMFALIIGYAVYISELTETLNKYEESKQYRMDQVKEEANRDNDKE